MKSPAFSSFRSLMDIWDDVLARENLNQQITNLVDHGPLIMFFTKNKDVYGAPEESRVIFAHMKDPDDDDYNDDNDAHFVATNLSAVIRGDGTQCVFGKKDINSIKIIPKENAKKRLRRLAARTHEPSKVAHTIKIIAKETRGA